MTAAAVSVSPNNVAAGRRSVRLLPVRLPENFSRWPEPMRRRYVEALSGVNGSR